MCDLPNAQRNDTRGLKRTHEAKKEETRDSHKRFSLCTFGREFACSESILKEKKKIEANVGKNEGRTLLRMNGVAPEKELMTAE